MIPMERRAVLTDERLKRESEEEVDGERNESGPRGGVDKRFRG